MSEATVLPTEPEPLLKNIIVTQNTNTAKGLWLVIVNGSRSKIR